jgi:hypothetical protein
VQLSFRTVLALIVFPGALVPQRSASAVVSLDLVPVGNAGNLNDPLTNRGAVNTAYAISKNEITLNQYCEFLNAVAKNGGINLWHAGMQSNANTAGIARSGSEGSYVYTVIGDDDQRPVAYINNFFAAARFANWMHNGQPTSGPNVSASTESGAYRLFGTVSGFVYHEPDAKFWVPTDSEWYKAAYYQPAAAGGDADGYWLYPMQTNSVPYSDQPGAATTPDPTRAGNFYKDDGLPNEYDDGYALTGSTASPSGNALTTVGAYTSADSFYGTFDQGGSLYEWTVQPNSTYALRGGGWGDDELALRATTITPQSLVQSKFDQLGFRLAAAEVPEPAMLGPSAVALLTIAVRRRGRQRLP